VRSGFFHSYMPLRSALQHLNPDSHLTVYRDKTSIQDVQNCAYVIFKDKATAKFYTYGGEIWHTSVDIMGTWVTTKSIPGDITKILEENKKKLETVAVKEDEKPPAIIVAPYALPSFQS
jgi:hypothetical protein